MLEVRLNCSFISALSLLMLLLVLRFITYSNINHEPLYECLALAEDMTNSNSEPTPSPTHDAKNLLKAGLTGNSCHQSPDATM